MTTRYCHECSAKKGWLPAAPSSLTGSQYQLDKFTKHTAPPASGSFIVSIFSDPSYANYATFAVDTAASGSLEVDDQGRRNIVWIAKRPVGSTFVKGVDQGAVDAVKLVLAHKPSDVHLFPTSSLDIATSTCAECGAALAY